MSTHNIFFFHKCYILGYLNALADLNLRCAPMSEIIFSDVVDLMNFVLVRIPSIFANPGIGKIYDLFRYRKKAWTCLFVCLC